MGNSILLFICALMLNAVQAGTLEDGVALNANLSNGYDTNVRPLKDQSQPLVVEVSLFIVALQEFDEVLESISLVSVFHIKWTDEKLMWSASDFGGIDRAYFGYEDVWVPELILTNPSEKLDSFGRKWQRIRYDNDGKALWKPGTVLQASCAVNAYYFPFDIQECYLQVYVWGYDPSEVKFNAGRDTVGLDFMSKHGTWDVIGTSVEVSHSGPASGVIFHFRLERKPQYLIINILLPILFLNLLNVLVFLLPAESGERVSFSITVLLSIAVFMTIVSDTLPKTSEPLPLISYTLLGSFVVSSVTTVITVLNLRLFNSKEDQPVPNWIVKMYLSLKLSCCRLRCGKHKVKDSDVKEDHVSFNNTKEGNHAFQRKTTTALNDKGINENSKHAFEAIEDSHDLQKVTWQYISKMIDFISLVITSAVIALSFTLFLIISRTSSK